MKRLVRHGKLNSPWGLAIAPAGFGDLTGALLVGNFGDGRITAYDMDAREHEDDDDTEDLGQLRGPNDKPISIDGLWGLVVGNGHAGGDANKVYFSAGPDGEQHGLFGSLALAP